MYHILGYAGEMNEMASMIKDIFGGEPFAFYPIEKDGSDAADPLQNIFHRTGVRYTRIDIEVDKEEKNNPKAKLITPVTELIMPGVSSALVFDEPVIGGETIMSGYAGVVANSRELGIKKIALVSITDRLGVTDVCCDPLYITAHGKKERVKKMDFIREKWPKIYFEIEEDLSSFENKIPIIDYGDVISRHNQDYSIVRSFMDNGNLIIIGADPKGSVHASGIHYHLAGAENRSNVGYYTLTEEKACKKLLSELTSDYGQPDQHDLKVVIFSSDEKEIQNLLEIAEKMKKKHKFDCIGLYHNNGESGIFYIDNKEVKKETFEKFSKKLDLTYA